jgi:hypothetical protein
VPLFAPPALEYVSTAAVELGSPLEVGESPEGRFRVVPITGGSFDGPGLARRIQPVGSDWQRILPDGTTPVEARYLVETGDGLVPTTSTGVLVASAERTPATVRYHLYRLS